MARPKKLVNGSMADGRLSPVLTFTDRRKAALEKALGAKLDDAALAGISAVCEEYFTAADVETNAGLLNDAAEWLDAVSRAAIRLRDEFSKPQRPEKDPETEAQKRQATRERHAINAGRAHVFVRLSAIMTAAGYPSEHPLDAVITYLPEAIAAVKRDHKSMRAPTWREGAAWDDWVAQLKQLMADNGLPAKTSKNGRPGQGFPRFVSMLQSHMPQKYRRHMSAPDDLALDGLSQAIYRAVKSREDMIAI